MRSTQIIKKLAQEAIDANGNINNKIADYVLNKLAKKELKIFLRRLKKSHMEQTIIVKYEGNLTDRIKSEIQLNYKNKKINYEKDRKIGGGIMIIANDMIINYTIAGLITNKMKAI